MSDFASDFKDLGWIGWGSAWRWGLGGQLQTLRYPDISIVFYLSFVRVVAIPSLSSSLKMIMFDVVGGGKGNLPVRVAQCTRSSVSLAPPARHLAFPTSSHL
jgi:hypothetical protein